MNIEILFSLSQIGGSKSKFQIFYVSFLNKDISITTKDNAMKFCMTTLHICSEGCVSQIFDLGPGFHFI